MCILREENIVVAGASVKRNCRCPRCFLQLSSDSTAVAGCQNARVCLLFHGQTHSCNFCRFKL